MQKLTDKKIAVVGAGGVGGYMAGMLGRACTHMERCGQRRKAGGAERTRHSSAQRPQRRDRVET